MKRGLGLLPGRYAALAFVGLWLAIGGGRTSAQSTCNVAHLSASDGGAFDSLGFATAISGDTALAGAFWDDDNGADSGSAYLFASNRTGWAQAQKLLALDGHPNDWFGRSAAIDGDTAMVGASEHVHLQASGSGAVYVFDFNGTTWVPQQELVAADGQLGDKFSYSLAISGDVAIIGAPNDNDNGFASGSAYVFQLDANRQQWFQAQKLLASDGSESDGFGIDVAVLGDVAVIGSPGSVNMHGAAYIFRFDGASWVQEQKLVASDGAFADEFGWSVSISGGTALIGALGVGPDKGAAYVFNYDGQTWVQAQKLLASDGGPNDQFGRSVSIDGNAAVVGAFGSDAVADDMGAAYVFRASAGVWAEQEQLLPDPGSWTAFFGWSVGLSGDTAVVGAYGESFQHGSIYVVAGLAGTDCNETGQADACDLFLGLSQDANNNGVPDECECPWDLNGSGAVEISDFLDLLGQWGSNPGGPPDFNGDGNVGIVDFLTLLSNWGPCA